MIARRSLEWFGAAACPPHLETPLRLTAIALLLRPMGPWFVRPAVLAAAAVVLISPRVLRTPAMWAAIAALIGIRIADNWPLADNHIYLLAYWALAIALSLGASDLPRRLATTSRWLIGLAFAFAVLWKACCRRTFSTAGSSASRCSPTLVLREAAMLIGGLSEADLAANRRALAPLPDGAALADPADRHRASPSPRAGRRLDLGNRAARGRGGHVMLAPARLSPGPGCGTSCSSASAW